MIAEMRDGVAAGRSRRLLGAQRALPRADLGGADHPTASRLVRNLKSQSIRFQYQTMLRPGRPQRSLREHEAIFDALAAHDARRRRGGDARAPRGGGRHPALGDHAPARCAALAIRLDCGSRSLQQLDGRVKRAQSRHVDPEAVRQLDHRAQHRRRSRAAGPPRGPGASTSCGRPRAAAPAIRLSMLTGDLDADAAAPPRRPPPSRSGPGRATSGERSHLVRASPASAR